MVRVVDLRGASFAEDLCDAPLALDEDSTADMRVSSRGRLDYLCEADIKGALVDFPGFEDFEGTWDNCEVLIECVRGSFMG